MEIERCVTIDIHSTKSVSNQGAYKWPPFPQFISDNVRALRPAMYFFETVTHKGVEGQALSFSLYTILIVIFIVWLTSSTIWTNTQRLPYSRT